MRTIRLQISRIIVAAFILTGQTVLQIEAAPNTYTIPQHPLATLKPSHPRLLVTSLQDFANIKNNIQGNGFLQETQATIEKKADQMLRQPVNKYTLKPTRYLLNVSRSVLERSYDLSMMYRITGDKRYADRLWDELNNAAQFPDWDPEHFLGTAEMTHAFAIAYDWLFDVWTPEQKAILKTAITEKGLTAGNLYYNHQINGVNWPIATTNWNLVCNGAMVVGALAIADEDNKSFCETVVSNALQSVPTGMNGYNPDGAWIEGPMYMALALKYNVVMIASMQSALKTDFGLSNSPGFSGVGRFLTAMVGPTGMPFNYADGVSRVIVAPEMFWLAAKFSEPFAANYEKQFSDHKFVADLLWYAGRPTESSMPKSSYFRGAEVASLRSSWTDGDAWFVAFKGGINGANHGHLDIGSFVLDRLGERWALDIGGDSYGLPGYFNKTERFDYYRTSTEGHNTLVFNGGKSNNQNTNAKASIIKFNASDTFAFGIVDMTAAYTGAGANSVKRGVALVNNKRVIIQDEYDMAVPADVYWQIQTPADITLSNNGRTALLQINGKQLVAEIVGADKEQFVIMPAGPSEQLSLAAGGARASLQAKNDNLKRLVIHSTGKSKATITVVFHDVNDNSITSPISPLINWN